MTVRLLLSNGLLIPLLLGLISSCTPRSGTTKLSDGAPPSPAASTAAQEFEQRLKAYAELERKLESQLPKLPDQADPERITEHKQALVKAIQQARSGAKQGDLFTPDVRSEFLQIVRSETGGPQGAEARKEIVETAAKKGTTETSAPVNLKVNSPYPADVSLSTVPPALLLKLPRIPKEVDYRFVGRHIILRSVKANVILDVLPGALPPPGIKKQ